MADEKYDPLTAYHEDLTRGLNPHVDCLVENFSRMSLLSEDELANLKAHKGPVKYLLDVVHARKEKHNDSQCFDELVKFMKGLQDTRLSELADKMRISQDDDAVPCVQAEQSQSSAVENFIPTTAVPETPLYGRQKSQALVTSNVTTNVLTVNNTAPNITVGPNSEDLLLDIINKAENDKGLFKVRFSTVLCTGLAKTGKTSFCNLLMDKTVPPSSGNFHTTFIKKNTNNTPPEQTKWREIDLQELNKLIDEFSSKKVGPLCNPDETWDVLFLLDVNVPTPALCLLQNSVLTFVTYKMCGENFEFKDSSLLVKNEKRYTKFIKEFLSSLCSGEKVAKKSEFPELEVNSNCRKFYTAFVGILDGSSSEESYTREAEVVNESLCIINDHMNCTIKDFRISFWCTDQDDKYLHLVNVTNHKENHFDRVKSGLEDFVVKNSTYRVPLRWMLLNFKIQKFCIVHKTSFIEYTDVYEKLWRIDSNENELKLALKFFHSVGALFYFHSIEGINNFVITDFHWIFDNFKYLHCTKDNAYRSNRNAKLVLKFEGELMSDMIEKIKVKHLGDVKLRDFMKLLEHLRFIAPLNQGNFFIPSILDSHEGYNVFDYYGEQKSKPPLLVTFSSGSLHCNVFSYLTAHISNNLPSNWSKPKYNEILKHRHTFKDLVTFCVNMNNYICYVCILDKTFFLEICIYSKSKNQCPADLHYTTFNFIEKSLKVVCEHLELPGDDFKYGFLCCKCKCEHLMVIKDVKNSNNKETLVYYCSKTDELVNEVLEEDHTVWFYKRSLSVHLHDQATADSDDANNTDGIMTRHMTDSLKSSTVSQEASTTTHNPSVHSLAIGSIRKYSHSQDCVEYQVTCNPPQRSCIHISVNTFSAPTSVIRSPPALKHLQVFRKHIGDHWFDLGVELLDDRDVGELDTIKQNFPHNTKKCCTEMFQLWLSRCTSASWEDLIYALQAIELYHVADKVSQFYTYDINPRCDSTPVGDYDKGGHPYYNRTTPVDGHYQRHRNSINLAPGEAMELERTRLDSIREPVSPRKK